METVLYIAIIILCLLAVILAVKLSSANTTIQDHRTRMVAGTTALKRGQADYDTLRNKAVKDAAALSGLKHAHQQLKSTASIYAGLKGKRISNKERNVAHKALLNCLL